VDKEIIISVLIFRSRVQGLLREHTRLLSTSEHLSGVGIDSGVVANIIVILAVIATTRSFRLEYLQGIGRPRDFETRCLNEW